MTPARMVLWIGAFGFLGFGMAFTLWPLPMAGMIQIPLPTPTARIDFAATYGGFELGFAAFLIACARREAWLRPGLWAMSAALAGFALVRILSLLVAAGPATTPIYIALALELAGTAAGIWALRRTGIS